jgi:hypothetical protein
MVDDGKCVARQLLKCVLVVKHATRTDVAFARAAVLARLSSLKRSRVASVSARPPVGPGIKCLLCHSHVF